jgi:hypothetical protein
MHIFLKIIQKEGECRFFWCAFLITELLCQKLFSVNTPEA